MDQPSASPLHSPHDSFFKAMFGQAEEAQDLATMALPERALEGLDWSQLVLQPGSFVDHQLSPNYSDLLFRVPWRGRPVYLYLLFEHKSWPEELRLTLLGYMVEVWRQHRKEGGRASRLPAIIPVVLYHGERPWPYSTKFSGCLEMPEDVRELLKPLQPDFEHLLLDLSRVPMEAVGGRLTTKLGLTLMKAVQEQRVLEWMETFADLLLELSEQPHKSGQLRAILRYLFAADVGAASTLCQLTIKIKQGRLRERVMSIAEQLRQEGKLEGQQEGRQQGRQQGTLIGQIQILQELLHLPVSSMEELAGQDEVILGNLLKELKGRLAR